MKMIEEIICPYLVEIFKNNNVIATGIWSGGKHFVEESPEQKIYVSHLQKLEGYDDKYAKIGFLKGEMLFIHSDMDGISFKEYSQDGRILYDSTLRKEIKYFIEEEEQPCGECRELNPKSDLQWTYDGNGIPYKKVCHKCYYGVQIRIGSHVHDPESGEYLEEDY